MQRQPGYRFSSAEHWQACLLVGADRTGQDGAAAIRPFRAFSPEPERAFATPGALAPAGTFAGEILWRDRPGTLYRLSRDEETPRTMPAPRAVALASRIVASGESLWAAGRGDTVESFDLESLSRRFVVAVGAPVIDIAADGRGGVRVLIAAGDEMFVVPVDCVGTIGARLELRDVPPLRAFVYLRRGGRLVALSADGRHVFGFPAHGGPPDIRLRSAALGVCFVGTAIASDTGSRVFLAGVDGLDVPRAHAVILDPFGVQLDDVPLRAAATGIAARADALLITDARGAYVLPAVDTVPESAADIGVTVVTPMLTAPETTTGRRWLRIEVSAILPEGSSIEIAYGAPEDPALREKAGALASDPAIPEPKRAQLLRGMSDFWSAPTTFHGADALANPGGANVAVPLHDVHGRYLWVALSLRAGAGGKLPVLSRLSVLYPGHTLMEHLPAIYQREEAHPQSFTRTLVGILETTTQDLDARIADMGRYIHPDHAAVEWLDYLARWLGLPWDDALSETQKRCIVRHGAAIARGRGTRAGLETLLECLIGGTPRRFRIVDTTVDLGLARIGGSACEGAALPAILGGLSATAARLDVQAVLGAMRLPCPDEPEDDATSRFLGRIRVDVAATAAEVERWRPWLARLVMEMVPLGTRARVRWTSAHALRGNRLGDGLTLEADPLTRLGTDAITGVARLPRTGGPLPASSDHNGPILQ